jgi:predicted  nucleic acid-binding Zn-ribbon protein
MGWEEEAEALVLERNRLQTEPYLDVYSAFRLMEKKYRLLKKKHIEIRNRVGVLQYEIQESIYQKTSNLEEVKSKLLIIAEDLSPRSAKEFDDIKVRFELSRQIKEQEHLINDLKSEADTARSQLSNSLEEIAQLQEDLSKKEVTNLMLKQELEGTRNCLASAETRLKAVEAQNGQYAKQLLEEKQRSAHQMNEMNKLVQEGPGAGLLGGGLKLMKRFGATTFFTKSAENEEIALDESEIEDDFVDIIGAKKGNNDGVEETEELTLPYDCVPPRRPLNFNKCHNSEINDIVYNKQYYMTGGSDKIVKIFERKGAGQSAELTSAEIDDMPPQDPFNMLTTAGPVISLDLKGDWLAAGCTDGIARIWSVSTGRLRQNLSGHANKINAIRLVGKSVATSLIRSFLYDHKGLVKKKLLLVQLTEHYGFGIFLVLNHKVSVT